MKGGSFMANTEIFLRNIFGTTRPNIRPLVLALNITNDLLFEQHISMSDIKATKHIYPDVARLLHKKPETVYKSVIRLAHRCWDALVEQDLVLSYLGRSMKQEPDPSVFITYLAVYIQSDIPFFEFIERDPGFLFRSRHMSTRLATLTFRQTFEERGRPDNLTFHSDRGSQYISKTFSELLQRCGAKQSFSASGRPLDNAVAEAFFSSFKREEAYRREYTSEKHFCRCVAEYITFYNEVRPHLTLRYQTPQAFEEAYYLSYIKKSCSTDSEP